MHFKIHPPQVFNDSNTFSEWFTRFLGVDSFGDAAGGNGPVGAAGEAAALDREKKILVVNRLHQILSPFMLRRMVSEGSSVMARLLTILYICAPSSLLSSKVLVFCQRRTLCACIL